jgi:hypothetical protein
VKQRNAANRSRPVALTPKVKAIRRDVVSRASDAIDHARTPPTGEFKPAQAVLERSCERCEKMVAAAATRTAKTPHGRQTWCLRCVKDTGVPTA